KKVYTYIPPLLLCYFIPALLNWPLGWINGSESKLYEVASRYFLPASLVLLCLGIDMKAIIGLGPKALIMFLAGSVGVIIGGPIAVLVSTRVLPGLINASPDDLWKGLSCIAGSWIGGSANQTAMKEIFGVQENLFGTMVVIDVIVANVWMALLLYGASITDRIDRWLKADTTEIESLKKNVAEYRARIEKIPSTYDLIILMAVAFVGVGLSHGLSNLIVPALEKYGDSLKAWHLDSIITSFFWIVLIATTFGLLISFTGLRKLEGVGASRWGTVFIYILVATIGMQMNLREVFDHIGLFSIGIIWIIIHGVILILVAKWIRAPFFFLAVGSQANIGGAASTPIVASAFSPSLAPVGVLLAVLGYALGTYGGIVCAYAMKAALGV
ncbi:MAG TPA: DUF819 family protein, partial [Saprospiraceae bacterium]|nr:DUF819 family protein [Saprospiraceae bacterium]